MVISLVSRTMTNIFAPYMLNSRVPREIDTSYNTIIIIPLIVSNQILVEYVFVREITELNRANGD